MLNKLITRKNGVDTVLLDVSGTTATEEKVLKGEIFTKADGTVSTGTLEQSSGGGEIDISASRGVDYGDGSWKPNAPDFAFKGVMLHAISSGYDFFVTWYFGCIRSSPDEQSYLISELVGRNTNTLYASGQTNIMGVIRNGVITELETGSSSMTQFGEKVYQVTTDFVLQDGDILYFYAFND